MAAPNTSPVIPPNLRTQWATRTAPQTRASNTATGPCQGRGPATTETATSTVVQAATTGAGWLRATRTPSVLPSAAGTERRQATTAATRPASTATAMPAIAAA